MGNIRPHIADLLYFVFVC